MDDPFLERLRRGLEPDFEIEQELGSGGQARVFLAREVALHRQVAIKTIRPEMETAVAVERFLLEAQTLAGLAHPNIVPIHRLGTTSDGTAYIVMEYLTGETLDDRIGRGPLPPDEVVRIARDILSALAAAHERNIIHRDIKPSNIFLQPGRAVLADFGIAKVHRSRGDIITKRGEEPRTPQYASPEQLAGAEVAPASDLWSLAAVLYEALTSRTWCDMNPVEDPVAGNWAGVPRRVGKALERALAFSPADRWPDAASFSRAIKPVGRPTWLPWVASGAVTTLVIGVALWSRFWRVPTTVDVSLGPFRPPSLGEPLRVAAYEELRKADGLHLAPLGDALAASGSLAPTVRHKVTGFVAEEAGRLHVALQVGDQHVEVNADSTDADWDVARKIALAVLAVAKPGVFPPAGCRPRTVEAYNAFIRGQEAFRLDDWQTARHWFTQAVRDPDFCVAEVRLWLAQRWSRVDTTVDLVRLLSRHGGVLPKADSLMIAAELAPTHERRYALYQRAVRKDPFGAIAPLQYGSDLFHRGPLAGVPLDSGVAVLRLARERDSTLAEVHDQLMWALIRLGERDSAGAALRALVANARATRDVHPDVFRLVSAMRFRPEDSVLPLLENVEAGAGDQMAQRVRLALSFDLAPYQALIGGQLAGDSAVSFGMRTHGRTARGLAWLALGRPAAGLRELDSAAAPGIREDRVPALQAAQWYLLAASLGIPGAPDSGAAAVAARTTVERVMDDSALGGRAAWTLAVEAWQRRDTATARALADRIPPRDSALRAIVAAIDSGRRAPRRALDLTTPLRGVREEQDGLGEPFARAILHLRRAEWYDAIGERENAERELRWHENSDFIGWLQGSIQSAEVDWVAGAYVRVREGMRRVDAGDLDVCADLRRMVDTLWVDVESGVDSLRRAGQAKAGACP